MMELKTDAFRYDRLKLSLWDIIKLVVGCTLKISGLKICCWRMPKQ